MEPLSPRQRTRGAALVLVVVAGIAALVPLACSSNRRAPVPPGSTPRAYTRGDTTPTVTVEILSVNGGSEAGGRFRVGDTPSVNFRVKKADGSAWLIGDFDRARVLLSGPTSNYQRVIPILSDVATRATLNGDGTYTYTFPQAIPANYAAPYNDSTSFGAADGELAGTPLQAGTYTIGLALAWDHTVDGATFIAAGNALSDVVIGDASIIVDPREVVGQANCNSCHENLREHRDVYEDVRMCVLCHTAGSEDANDPNVAGGTPGVSVEFSVLMHRVHNGSHLPSVLGVTTKADGTRDYTATPAPYIVANSRGGSTNYSASSFPMMPSAYVAYLFDNAGTNYMGTGGNGPMPRDQGYTGLTLSAKEKEDRMRAGNVSCAKCHGDPDGVGPLAAPADGDLAYSNPQRQSCGSCHDDIEWGKPYTANGQTMGAQADNANCILCHEAGTGAALGARDGHKHPYSNPAINTGINVTVTGVAAGSGTNGRHAAGDTIVPTFSVKNDAGADLQINALTRFQMIVSGPASNPQWVLPNLNVFDFAFRKASPFTGNGTVTGLTVGAGAQAETIAVVHTSATGFDVVGSVSALQSFTIGAGSGAVTNVTFAGVTFTVTQGSTAFAANDRWYLEVVPLASSYTRAVPRDLTFERLGLADGNAQVLAAGNTPVHWGRQTVYERTALVGGASVLGAAAPALQRFVVADATSLAGVAVGDRVVLAAGTANEEYAQVSRIVTVDDVTGADLGVLDRFYFTTHTRYAHAVGVSIQECTLTTRREGTDYTVATTNASGISLLGGRFTATNPVVMSYRVNAKLGYYRAPGEALQAVYTPATGESEDIGAAEGDWTGLPIVDGTYTVGMWSNIDFTVTPVGVKTTAGAWNNLATDNTTYRSMAPPATRTFLLGNATVVAPRDVIDRESCDRCHGEIAAHGFGRRGWDTCILCHASPGAEDAPLYQYGSWYVGATPRVTMDFRELLHKIHMGHELANASSYAANGVFLGTPYPVGYGDIAFPAMPGGAMACESCHGAGSKSWIEPAGRDHPVTSIARTKEWTAACASCHDSTAAIAHMGAQTSNGEEACSVCHGPGKEWSVELKHKRY